MNRENKKRSEMHIGTGMTSLMMIFVVLCLTLLSVLAYAGARGDLKLTHRMTDMTQAYYEASGDVQRVLMQMDEYLLNAREQSADAGAYQSALDAMQIEGTDTQVNGNTVSFSMDAGAQRSLQVEVEIATWGDTGARYRVKRQVLVTEDTWGQEDAPMQLVTP